MPVSRDSSDILLSADAMDDAWGFIKGVHC